MSQTPAPQTCDLCAGECRGHTIGGDWTPEPGSRAYVPPAPQEDTLVREIQWAVSHDGSIDGVAKSRSRVAGIINAREITIIAERDAALAKLAAAEAREGELRIAVLQTLPIEIDEKTQRAQGEPYLTITTTWEALAAVRAALATKDETP